MVHMATTMVYIYAKSINQVVLRWENRVSVMAQMVLVPENHTRRGPLVMFVGVEPPYLHTYDSYASHKP